MLRLLVGAWSPRRLNPQKRVKTSIKTPMNPVFAIFSLKRPPPFAPLRHCRNKRPATREIRLSANWRTFPDPRLPRKQGKGFDSRKSFPGSPHGSKSRHPDQSPAPRPSPGIFPRPRGGRLIKPGRDFGIRTSQDRPPRPSVRRSTHGTLSWKPLPFSSSS